MIDEKATVRFWSKVDKNGPIVSHVDGLGPCWLWAAALDKDGYGKLRVGGRMLSAHRVSYELHNEPIPNGMCVCHCCDTRLCVNPTHLFLGTQADNNRDMTIKGRQDTARGEASGTAKLTEADVLSIRALYATGGLTHRELAKRFGVERSNVSHIVSRKTWSHVAA